MYFYAMLNYYYLLIDFFFLLMVIYEYTRDLLYPNFSLYSHSQPRDKLVEKKQNLFPGFLVLRTSFEKKSPQGLRNQNTNDMNPA